MTKLILVRHGQTDWQKQKRIQGALDIPLNDEGRLEAKKVSEELSKIKIDVVYSSTLSCSFDTACEIANRCNLKVKKTDEFNEVNQGVWQGLLLSAVKIRYKRQYNIWKTSPSSAKPPRGESMREAYDRAVSAMHKIIDKNKSANICVVSHDIILSLIKCHVKNIDLDRIWRFVPEGIWWEIFEI